MLRKLNFTERVRIPKEAVHIALRREGGVLAFDAAISLDRLAVASDAEVWLDAYYRTSFMRFDLGTAGALRPPPDRRLTAIDSGNVVRFRLKVVDPRDRRILAIADGITVAEREEGGRRISLLPVNFRDLGEEVWALDFDDAGGPTLELNSRVDGIQRMATADPKFFALVYPAAIRQILGAILFIERHDPFEEGDEWWTLWIRWAAGIAGPPPADDDDDLIRRAWIDDVARKFCGDRKVVERLVEALRQDEE
ncbi:MAG: hypothetical protein LC732_07195 [Acidobacteria bacterium]|nr:hypothetical protein [Acidobacteriota bacterium]